MRALGKAPDQVTTLLTRSRRIGDDHLARAVALVALERGWSEVIQSYSGAATDVSVAALQELGELRAGQQDRKERFAESMVFSSQAPSEVSAIAQLGDNALDRLADTAEAQPA